MLQLKFLLAFSLPLLFQHISGCNCVKQITVSILRSDYKTRQEGEDVKLCVCVCECVRERTSPEACGVLHMICVRTPAYVRVGRAGHETACSNGKFRQVTSAGEQDSTFVNVPRY